MTGLSGSPVDDGFSIVDGLLDVEAVARLRDALAGLDDGDGVYSRNGVYAARSLLRRSADVRELAVSDAARSLVEPVLGSRCRPVKATYFDKTPAANWMVPWHQDLTICVQERREVPGFGPWSVKAGMAHVQAPVAILERIMAVRFALDDNDEQSGPLKVLPGTHRLGRLGAEQIAELRQSRPEVVCKVPAGGAVLMRPLLLHASSSMTTGRRRRVIHIEYAGCELPGGLEWAV